MRNKEAGNFMGNKEKTFCPYTTFVPRVERFRAVQYDGNIRCLDIFPIQDMKYFITKGKTLISYKFKITANIGDFIFYKDKKYQAVTEKCFMNTYAPAPECLAETLVGTLSTTRKMEDWMLTTGVSE